MKKSVIKIFMLILILIIGVPSNYSNAYQDPGGIDAAQGLIPSIMSDDIAEDLNPESGDVDETITEPFTSLIVEVVQKLLSAIQIIGGLLSIISIAMYGLGMLLDTSKLTKDIGSMNTAFGGYNPQVRAQMMDYIKVLILGSVLMFSSSSIVLFVMKILLQ